ncbi:MAG: hypothetical protein K2N94_08550, partial [Lachnospiraceae bacterium]|nr:hypothetical protein [Lachnospiraceae bacterium]
MTILKPIPEADSAQRVEFLRNAISEFPSEWQLQSRLADALVAMGNEKCGKEAVFLYEEVLKNEIDNERRRSVTASLMWLYSQMGDLENAERIILSQSPVDFSREVLLARVLRNEKTEEYRAEAILALLHELYMVILQSVMAEYSLAHSQAGLDTLLTVAGLYECIFGNGEYGIYHNDMSELYLNCSSVAIELNDPERALKYLEIGLDHYLEFRKTREKIPFEAPLINRAKNYRPGIVLLRRKDFEDYMQSFSPECVDAIRNNPRYAPLLAE